MQLMQRSLSVLRTLALGLLLLLGPAAWGGEGASGDGALAAGNTRFALALYGGLCGKKGNLFVSPYSISAALAMTRQGARGETARQMDEVLHFPADCAAAFGKLDAALEAPEVSVYRDGKSVREPAYAFSVANALWMQQGYPLLPAFLDSMKDAFGAGLERTDFGQTEAARSQINEWVEKETRERIRDLVPEGAITPLTRLVLANAIYLKAGWADPFKKAATKDEPFRLAAGGGTVDVPLMRRTGRYRYAEADGLQVLELPYRGNALSMVVLLPAKVDGLPAVEDALDAEHLAAWLGALASTQVEVHLPRFEVTQGLNLNEVLAGLGMKDAFSAQDADFSGMTEAERLSIGAVIHKAFVAVDEVGTEAAAATAVAMLGMGAPVRQPDPVVFRADRPFLFLIRHAATGTVLFLGRLVDPS